MKRMTILLLVLVLLLPMGAGAEFPDELALTVETKPTEAPKKAENILTSPALLVGEEGTLFKEDVSIGGTLYNAYKYPRCKRTDKFVEVYGKWMEQTGYQMSAVTIGEYSGYQLTDPSGLYAYLVPEYGNRMMLFIPDGITVGPLMLPNPADFCYSDLTPTDTPSSKGVSSSSLGVNFDLSGWSTTSTSLYFEAAHISSFDVESYIKELEKYGIYSEHIVSSYYSCSVNKPSKFIFVSKLSIRKCIISFWTKYS